MLFRFLEKILIEEARGGNPYAFSKLYKNYEEPIYRFIYFRIGDKEISEDLTSEVFLKIFDFLKNKEAKIQNFRAFLYKTANNSIIDFYRLRKDTVSLDETKEISHPSDAEDQTDKLLQINQLKKYFNQLKPEYQNPVLLHYFEGLSYKEIAEVLGESEANVKMRSHRGIKLLKSLLRKT